MGSIPVLDGQGVDLGERPARVLREPSVVEQFTDQVWPLSSLRASMLALTMSHVPRRRTGDVATVTH
jgi:hypothetical protein